MQAPTKKDASEPSQDREAQALLSRFLRGAIKTLEPAYDPKTGYRYPEVEALVGDQTRAIALLNRLTQEGLLEAKLYNKVIYCPQCGSNAITFRYCCPFCKSFNIKKSSLIEHVRCGYMDLEENFHKNGKLTCPKCHEDLRKLDVDFRKAGVWCACKDCRKSFDIPTAEHFCTQCRTTSNFEQAIIKDIYSYTLSAHAKEKMSSNMVLIEPIRDLLIKNGFKVDAPAFLVGKSGAKHSFNIAAKHCSGKLVVVDLALSAEGAVSEQPVIALFAKTFDVSPQQAFLVAVPKLGDNARKMAELYNIQAIDARNQDEALAVLAAKLTC
jgi:hypothetical protein